jgi:hypothetical protein
MSATSIHGVFVWSATLARQFFNIPLGSHPALVEMQNLLRRRLPEGTQFNDPATFHITLVFIEDDKGLELSFDELAADLPIFGIGGDYVRTFDSPTGRAVHLALEWSPQLIYLQSAIYYKAQALGAKISQFSYPARWKPHITLANLQQPDNDGFNDPMAESLGFIMTTPVHLEARHFALNQDESFEALKDWPLRADIPVQEFMRRIEANIEQRQDSGVQLQEQATTVNERLRLTLTCVSEMKGGYPNIKLPGDIDVTAITAQGRQFVTLPIGEVDAHSRNDRRYTRKSMEQMVEQINSNRPEGGWGHIKDEDMATAYDPPAIRWLAAEIDKKGMVWGKGLPLTPEAQQYFDDARLTNARVGTSLHAWAFMEGDDVVEIELIKLDLADPARVGVPIAAAKPQLSAEMHSPDEGGAGVPAQGQDGQTPEAVSSTAETFNRQPVQEDKPVTDSNRVTELELERKDLRTQIATLETEGKRLKDVEEDVNEVREQWAIPKDGDIVKAFRQFKEQYDNMVAENSALLLDSATAIIDEKVKIKSVRPLVLELVKTEKPTTRKALTRAIDDVLAREFVKELLAAKLQEEMGPAQTPPPGQGHSNTAPADEWLMPAAEV